MKSITPSKFREKLFPSLKSAALGDSLIVKTKTGPVLVTAAGKMMKPDARQAKIEGRIVGDLDKAQEELRAHLEWPR